MILVWVQKKENFHRLERELHFLSKAELYNKAMKMNPHVTMNWTEVEFKRFLLSEKHKEENVGALDRNIAALQDAIDDLFLIKSFSS
jgi:hypothetical protein